jgi:type I restriction enzyme S subunit
VAEWTIAEVAAERGLVGGPFGSNLGGKDYVDSGVPVIRGSNMGERYLTGDFTYVTQAKVAADLSRNLTRPGDLVFTQRGTLGQVSIVPEGGPSEYVISQSQMRLRVNRNVADPRFVYYVCTAPGFTSQISDNAISTGVPHINLGILARLTIPAFPIAEQRSIVEVLWALDDKIAASDRQGRLALELADAQFARVVSGVPMGRETFGDLADVGGGGTPNTSVGAYWNGDVPWATPTDVTGLKGPYLSTTNRMITIDGLAACPSKLYPKGSILMTSRATVGAFAVARKPVAVNQGFIVVNAQAPVYQWWLFHEMRSRVSEFISHANGATFLELSRGKFKQFRVRMPTPDMAQLFSNAVEPLHAIAAQSMVESTSLSSTRDALLPLLMSGKIRVRDAEEVV